MESDRHIYTRGYNGPTTERTPQYCANEWHKLGLETIDNLLLEQLQFSAQRNENIVTVVDIGSGKEAKLLQAIASDASITPLTRAFLITNPVMSLECIGLTDVLNREDFQRSLIKQQTTLPEMRVTIRNIAYTLTARQTLENFLHQQNITKIHLALATWSLAYLSPNIFQEVITTSMNVLASKGRFLGVGYNDTVSGIGFKYHPDRDVVHFSIRNNTMPSNL